MRISRESFEDQFRKLLEPVNLRARKKSPSKKFNLKLSLNTVFYKLFERD